VVGSVGRVYGKVRARLDDRVAVDRYVVLVSADLVCLRVVVAWWDVRSALVNIVLLGVLVVEEVFVHVVV